MNTKELVIFLTETVHSSSESESSGWSDVCSIKPEFSEEEDECDEDDDDTLFFPLMQYLIRLRRKRVDDYLHIIDSWTDSKFKNKMRVSRKTAFRLIGNNINEIK